MIVQFLEGNQKKNMRITKTGTSDFSSIFSFEFVTQIAGVIDEF